MLAQQTCKRNDWKSNSLDSKCHGMSYESAWKLLPSTFTIAVYYHYSARQCVTTSIISNSHVSVLSESNRREAILQMKWIFHEEKLMWHRPVGSNAVVVDFLLRTPHQWLIMLFKGPDNTQKLPRSLEGSEPPWFLGRTRVYPPIDISIASAVFAWPTDRQTDRHTHRQTTLLSL